MCTLFVTLYYFGILILLNNFGSSYANNCQELSLLSKSEIHFELLQRLLNELNVIESNIVKTSVIKVDKDVKRQFNFVINNLRSFAKNNDEDILLQNESLVIWKYILFNRIVNYVTSVKLPIIARTDTDIKLKHQLTVLRSLLIKAIKPLDSLFKKRICKHTFLFYLYQTLFDMPLTFMPVNTSGNVYFNVRRGQQFYTIG